MTLTLHQYRGEFNIGPLHLYTGMQLEPQQIVAVGHAHDQPHLMVLLNPPLHNCPHCSGALPVPAYRITVDDGKGGEIVKELGPYGIAYIRAGYEHSIEQLTPGARGMFACIFPRYDENGKLMDDPKKEATPGVIYTHG